MGFKTSRQGQLHWVRITKNQNKPRPNKKGSGKSCFFTCGIDSLKAEGSDTGMTPNSELKPNPRRQMACTVGQSAKKRHIYTKEVSEQNRSVLSIRISACSLMELSGTQPQHSIYWDIHWITKLQLNTWAIAQFLLSIFIKQKSHSRQQNSLCSLWSLQISLYCWISSGHWLPCSAEADFEWTPCRTLLEIVHPHVYITQSTRHSKALLRKITQSPGPPHVALWQWTEWGPVCISGHTE